MVAMPSGHFGLAAVAIEALVDALVFADETVLSLFPPSVLPPPLSASARPMPPPMETKPMTAASATGNFLGAGGVPAMFGVKVDEGPLPPEPATAVCAKA